MVNRPYMLDLQPDRSLIRELLFLGLDVYLIDWGYPDGSDRFTPLNEYIGGYLDRCVDAVLNKNSVDCAESAGRLSGRNFQPVLCSARSPSGWPISSPW